MTHLWVRAEQRPNEERVGLTPEGAAALLKAGIKVTVEESSVRAIGLSATGRLARNRPREFLAVGACRCHHLRPQGTAGRWQPLTHRHIMFGHAYKGQPAGQVLLRRFKAARHALRSRISRRPLRPRVAAFGIGRALQVRRSRSSAGPRSRREHLRTVSKYASKQALLNGLSADLPAGARPRAIIIGALGRVGTGAADLCAAMDVAVTKWDMAETASGGPFPEVLQHEIFLNCILARPGCPSSCRRPP